MDFSNGSKPEDQLSKLKKQAQEHNTCDAHISGTRPSLDKGTGSVEMAAFSCHQLAVRFREWMSLIRVSITLQKPWQPEEASNALTAVSCILDAGASTWRTWQPTQR